MVGPVEPGRDPGGSHMREELVGTKLTVPRVRQDRLPRARLVEALDRAMSRGVILVCCPAGFGKTTLLSDWAAAAEGRVAWVSLDQEDNDPVRFWRYVVAACERGGIHAGDRLRTAVDGSGLTWQAVLTILINELETLTEDAMLILDDYHTVESPSIHEGVASLLDRLPPRLHVVIATRADPTLPLARLRAQDRLAEVRAADLRFTLEESVEFLRGVWGLTQLSTQDVAVLDTQTEGWAVGLQLAALSLQGRGDPNAFLDRFSGTHRFVLDYLSEEVLERQRDEVRAFLIRTSILERLNGPLCDAVTGRSDGQQLLEEIERANLFVISLDDERRWYRFHHLFGELLLARLHRDDPGLVPELHARAAAWCEEHGLIDEAVRHALASGEASRATRIVEEHLDETLRRGETVSLERWLSALPNDAVRARPTLCLTAALMQLHLGRLQTVERLLDHAERFTGWPESRMVGVPTDGGMVGDVRAAIALLRSEVATARGDSDAASEAAQVALAATSIEERGPRFSARWVCACADWMRGRMDDAESQFVDVLIEGRRLPDTYSGMSPFFALGRLQEARGRLGLALRTYRDGLNFVMEDGRLSTMRHAAEAHVGIAQVLYQRDRVDQALRHVTAAMEVGRPVLDVTTPVAELVILAWIRHALSDASGALAAMEEAFQLRPSTEIVTLHNPAPAERARLLLAHGRTEEAVQWVEQRGLSVDDDISYPGEREHLVLVRVLLAQDDPEAALSLLARLGSLADAHDRAGSLIEIRALRALALQAAGRHNDALSALSEAVSSARPEGYVRVFADEGLPMSGLFRSLVVARQRGRVPELSALDRQHMNRIIRAFSATPRGTREAAGAGAPRSLTDRELEVLRLIAAGKRNGDIARDLVVTLETVKKHVSHIFDKLGATNRTEAVASAREVGLLP